MSAEPSFSDAAPAERARPPKRARTTADCPICGDQEVPLRSGRIGAHHPIHVQRANTADGKPYARQVRKTDRWCEGVGELPEPGRPGRPRKAVA
jgi:ribosomal protein L44E